jgi:hypothetical protein
MHVTSADRTYEDIVATTAQSKNREYRPPSGRLANCTQTLFSSRMRFIGQDGDRPVKYAFNTRWLRKASPLLWLLALTQAHARSATVLVDEFDSSHFQGSPHCQVIGSRHGRLAVGQVGPAVLSSDG